jgi:hypothetical protein
LEKSVETVAQSGFRCGDAIGGVVPWGRRSIELAIFFGGPEELVEIALEEGRFDQST